MNNSRLFPASLRSIALRSRAARLRVSKPVLSALPILGAVPILAMPAVAAPAKLTGVRAWTNASQTYVRVRPDQSMPIVAKVGTHTPLYVWGKYNGWYRVQTHDDIFGWVYYKLLNSPGLEKVSELTASAVESSALRSANITMWGTPEQLKDYYAKTGAKGAAKGLIEMGVPITIGGSKPRGIKASAIKPRVKPTTRKATAQKVVTRLVPKPRVVTPILATRVPVVVPPVVAPPVVQQVATVSSGRIVTTPQALLPQAAVRTLLPATPKVVAHTATPPKPAPRHLTAKERKRDELRNKMGMKEKTPPLSIGQIAPVSPEDLMKARRAYLDARKDRLKETPSGETQNEGMGGPKITPSSYERTSDATLDRKGWAPFNASGWSGSTRSSFSTADWSAQNAPGFRLVTQEAEAATLDNEGIDEEESRRWNSLPALGALDSKQAPVVRVVSSAQKKPPARGGSPRDRYRGAKSDFRTDIAKKALSYRGRPYVFGASSPRRGFDCSGLIYYVLRQRGYNPPRVASGYRKYGTAVARKNLKAGDLLLFANTYKRGISHIGIYIGNNNFVHAASTRQGVRTDSLSTKYFANKYYCARRVPQK